MAVKKLKNSANKADVRICLALLNTGNKFAIVSYHPVPNGEKDELLARYPNTANIVNCLTNNEYSWLGKKIAADGNKGRSYNLPEKDLKVSSGIHAFNAKPLPNEIYDRIIRNTKKHLQGSL